MEIVGFEPMNLLHAMQALSQLSYTPIGINYQQLLT